MFGLGGLDFSSWEIINNKSNKHLSGDKFYFRRDTRLDDLPRYFLSLFSYDCMHNKSDIYQSFQLLCMNRPSVQSNLSMPDASWKEKYNSSTHLYKCLSRIIRKNPGRDTNPKTFSSST